MTDWVQSRGGVPGPGAASAASGDADATTPSPRRSRSEIDSPMETSVSKPHEGARLFRRRRAPVERRVATSLRLRFIDSPPRQDPGCDDNLRYLEGGGR